MINQGSVFGPRWELNYNAAWKTLSRKVHTTPSLLQDRILNYRHCQQVSDVANKSARKFHRQVASCRDAVMEIGLKQSWPHQETSAFACRLSLSDPTYWLVIAEPYN